MAAEWLAVLLLGRIRLFGQRSEVLCRASRALELLDL
jgi:hypothetical protein